MNDKIKDIKNINASSLRQTSEATKNLLEVLQTKDDFINSLIGIIEGYESTEKELYSIIRSKDEEIERIRNEFEDYKIKNRYHSNSLPTPNDIGLNENDSDESLREHNKLVYSQKDVTQRYLRDTHPPVAIKERPVPVKRRR